MDQQRKAMGLPWRSSSSKIRRLKFAGKNRRTEYVFQKQREKKKNKTKITIKSRTVTWLQAFKIWVL